MHVKGVERSLKWSYTILHIFAHDFLNISLIFGNNLQHLQHALTYIYHLMVWLESPESQLSRCFFKIENRLNIKKVVSKNVMSPYNVF